MWALITMSYCNCGEWFSETDIYGKCKKCTARLDEDFEAYARIPDESGAVNYLLVWDIEL